MSDPPRIRLVLTTVATDEDAARLAHAVVERGLAACVQILPRVRSVYRWKGAIQDEEERLLILKTTAGRASALCDEVRSLHPYELPEVVVLDPAEVDPGYAAWVASTVGAVED